MEAINATTFWNRSTADRLEARKAIQSCCGDFGDSSGSGFAVVIRRGSIEDLALVAAEQGLEVVFDYWTTSRGQTFQVVELGTRS